MKKSIVLTAILLLALQATHAQSTYSETRDVTGFTKVGFAVAGEVIIDLGSRYSVVLEGDKGYISDIETKVYGKELRIKTDRWFNTGNKKVTVRITMPSLEGISVSGSGRVTVNDPLKGEDLDIGISGSGKAFLGEVTLDNVDCAISGSGSLNISGSGSIDQMEVSISGSGDYYGESTKVRSLEAHISGSGNCDCYVTGTLEASISGSGDIYYSGNPKINASVSGSGKLRMK
jgi:hypothetical protein